MSETNEITTYFVEFNASVHSSVPHSIFSTPQSILQCPSLFYSASHLTPHTSHLIPHTSLLPPHISHHTAHTSPLTPQTSTSHLRPLTSDLGPQTSDLKPQTSLHTSPSFSASVHFSVPHSILQCLSSLFNVSVTAMEDAPPRGDGDLVLDCPSSN